MSGVDLADGRTPDEALDAFRQRAKQWLADNMPLLPPGADNFSLSRQDRTSARARQLQRRLHDGGFAGLCFPEAYGGHGLPAAYQKAFNEESLPYEMPTMFSVPTLSILAATLLDFGTEEQKRRHIPAMLRGDELWVQFLSEPTGGSDLAGVLTRATRDGDVFVVNGSKIWTTGADRSDYAMCLARTDWSVPKHRGLTMFIVAIHQPAIEVRPIPMVNGSAEFCQEFLDDVAVPASDVVGDVGEGWAVASRLLHHERDAVGGGSPYASGASTANTSDTGRRTDLVELARKTGQAGDPRVRQLVAEAHVNDRVQQQLAARLSDALRLGRLPGPATALGRLLAANNSERRLDIALEVAGAGAGAWTDDQPEAGWGILYLSRQAGSLGGGSTEMQRNIISERLMGMPREHAADRDVPFDQVRHNVLPPRPGSETGGS